MQSALLAPNRRQFAVAAGLLALTAAPLWAHPGAGPAHGIMHGAAHPLGGWDHLLAMVAVGLWAAQAGGRSVWLFPLAFVLGMVGGGAAGMMGAHMPAVESGILITVLLLGALVAAAVRVPAVAGVGLLCLFGAFHGHAHGAEMPAGASALGYALGFCLTTALLHAGGVFAVLGLRNLGGQLSSQRWVRLCGSAIGAAGLVGMLV